MEEQISSRSRFVAFLLSLLMICGICGAHRLYAGRWGIALFQFLTAGLFGVWQVIDIILLLTGNMKDDEGRYVVRW